MRKAIRSFLLFMVGALCLCVDALVHQQNQDFLGAVVYLLHTVRSNLGTYFTVSSPMRFVMFLVAGYCFVRSWLVARSIDSSVVVARKDSEE